MTKGDKLIIGITLLVMVAIAAWQAIDAGKEESRDPFLPELSSLSALPSGSKASYLVLEDLGRRPIRWGRSFAQLRGRKGALVTFGATFNSSMPTQIDSGEIDALKEWVADGNTLLAFGDATRTVFEMQTEQSGGTEKGSGEGSLQGLSFEGCIEHFSKLEASDKTLINSESGVFAIERIIGSGRAYLFASETVLSNEMLGKADNAALLTLAPNGQTVFLDDFHRGHVAGGSPLELLPKPLSTALLLCLLVGIVAVAKQSFRFGPLREGEPRILRSGAEIAWSLSRLLRQAGASATAATEMVRAFKTEIGQPQDAPIDAALSRLTGEHEELRSQVRHLDSVIERGAVTPKQLVELATALSEVRRLIRDQAKGIHID